MGNDLIEKIKKFEEVLNECSKAKLGISIYKLKRYILHDVIELNSKQKVVVEIFDPDMSRRKFAIYKVPLDYSRSDYSDVDILEEFEAINIEKYLKGRHKKDLKPFQIDEELISAITNDPDSSFNFTWFLFLGDFYNICKGYGIDTDKSIAFLP